MQVFAGAFAGGPIAAVYLVWKNFKALGNESLARQTILWGSILVLATVVSVPFLPDKFPNYALPAVFGGVAMVVANNFQMRKKTIEESGEYGFASFWRVTGVVVVSIIVFMVVILAFWFALSALGLKTFD